MLSGNFAEMTTSTPFRNLLHAANLRHGTDGFTSLPKEGALKNLTASAGFEPTNLGTKGQHATCRTSKPLKMKEYLTENWEERKTEDRKARKREIFYGARLYLIIQPFQG